VGPSFAPRNGPSPRNAAVPRSAPFARAFERFGKPLSARERQIVTLVLQGHSTESIARHLDISPGTVKIHRKNIYRKLAISTQAELFAAFLGAIA
jgi:DNA-binding CsgD family transcriptional regulator